MGDLRVIPPTALLWAPLPGAQVPPQQHGPLWSGVPGILSSRGLNTDLPALRPSWTAACSQQPGQIQIGWGLKLVHFGRVFLEKNWNTK